MHSTAIRTERLEGIGSQSVDSVGGCGPRSDAESRAGAPTGSGSYPGPVRAAERVTSIGGPSPSERKTRIITSAGTGAPSMTTTESPGRRIVGVLVTYTWRREGDLWPILEGRNYIGAGTVGDAPGEPPCDVMVPNDPEMSSAHALILCRAGRYEILDNRSANGTFVNDEFVTTHGRELKNYDRILTGSTAWTFIKIVPDSRVEPPKRPERVESDSSCAHGGPAETESPGSGNRTVIE